MKLRIVLIVCCLWGGLPTSSDALTVEEILLLKQNGVSEKTIQMMLQSELQAQARDDRAMGVRTITRPGGQSSIVYSTGRGDQDQHDAEERLKEERAWEMLRHIIVDARAAEGKRPGTKD